MIDDLVRVHRYEQRGCGRSTGDPPYTVERWLNDLEQLRKHWEPPQWIVCGHSFGAELALAYAAAFPSRARAIIYMSCLPAVFADRFGEEEFRANRAARIPEPLRLRFLDLRRLRDEGGEEWNPALAAELSRIGLAAEFGDSTRAALHVGVMVESALPVNQEINVALGEDFRRYATSDEFRAGLRQMTCPTLVLHGDRDLRPMWAAERLAEQLPNSRLVRLPGGHFPWLEVPFELRRTLRGFIADVVSFEFYRPISTARNTFAALRRRPRNVLCFPARRYDAGRPPRFCVERIQTSRPRKRGGDASVRRTPIIAARDSSGADRQDNAHRPHE